jgi:hypothetical protein
LREFFDEINKLALQHDAQEIKACCASAAMPAATTSICSFAAYIASGKKPRVLLESAPHGKEQVQWLWRWDAAVQRTGPSDFPDGFAGAYVDALFHAADSAPSDGFRRIFGLYQHADGEYAEYIADRLVKLFEARPRTVLAGWPVVKKNEHLVERALELYPERQSAIASVYRKQCVQDRRKSCAEALKVFSPEKP